MNNYLRQVIKIFLPNHGIIIQVIRFLFVSVKFLLYTLWLLSIYILYDSYQDTIMKCFEFKVFAWNFLQPPLPKKNNCNSTELQQKNLGWHSFLCSVTEYSTLKNKSTLQDNYKSTRKICEMCSMNQNEPKEPKWFLVSSNSYICSKLKIKTLRWFAECVQF